jgi:AraC-like DNA-binding protein
MAKRVFVSGRTLQRKLADEGTNFRTLLLEVRRGLAEQYITDKNMLLAEISYMLGFSDVSSFSRAFKKWTGDPPAAFRSNLG